MTRLVRPARTVSARFLRVVIPAIAVSIVVTTTLTFVVSRRALVERTEEIALLRSRALGNQLQLEYESLRGLGLESVEFYRSQLVRYVLEAAEADVSAGGAVDFARGASDCRLRERHESDDTIGQNALHRWSHSCRRASRVRRARAHCRAAGL